LEQGVTGKNITQVEVAIPGGAGTRKVGVRKDGKTVYLYLLDDEEALQVDGPIEILGLLTAIRDICCEGVPLSAIDWRLRSGAIESSIAIDGDGPSRRMTISNAYVCYAPPASLADYSRDSGHEFSPTRRLDRGPPQRPETYFLQDTPDGKTYLLSHASPEDTEVVYVDSRKLLDLLREHAPEQLLSEDELRHRKQSGLMGEWSREPHGLLRISCVQTSKGLTFGISSGNADLLASLLDSKTDTFPIAVNKGEAALMRKLCGAGGRKPVSGSAFRP
jgi:hypothetical protein